MKRQRRPQRQVRYVDPSVTPMGRPKALPVGQVTVAKMSRQLRRQQARELQKLLERHHG